MVAKVLLPPPPAFLPPLEGNYNPDFPEKDKMVPFFVFGLIRRVVSRGFLRKGLLFGAPMPPLFFPLFDILGSPAKQPFPPSPPPVQWLDGYSAGFSFHETPFSPYYVPPFSDDESFLFPSFFVQDQQGMDFSCPLSFASLLRRTPPLGQSICFGAAFLCAKRTCPFFSSLFLFSNFSFFSPSGS